MISLSSTHNEHSILIEIPFGIPNPKEKCPSPTEIDTRSRVPINSSQVTNWYSAINVLRLHIGDIFDIALNQKKEWEQRAISLQEKLVNCDKESNDTLSKKMEILSTFITQESTREENKNLRLPSGSSGNISFGFSLLNYEINMKKNQPAKAYEALLLGAIQIHCVKFGLGDSEWTPHQPSTQLKKTLEKKGPLLVFGNLGPNSYEESPFTLENKFMGKEVWGWKKGAKRSSPVQMQAVILVGAWIEKQEGRVYFIDPKSHLSLENRKIYVISYANLLANIVNHNNEPFSTKTAENDLYKTPRYTAKDVGRVPLFEALSVNQHPGLQYDERCHSTYAYYSTNVKLKS